MIAIRWGNKVIHYTPQYLKVHFPHSIIKSINAKKPFIKYDNGRYN